MNKEDIQQVLDAIKADVERTNMLTDADPAKGRESLQALPGLIDGWKQWVDDFDED